MPQFHWSQGNKSSPISPPPHPHSDLQFLVHLLTVHKKQQPAEFTPIQQPVSHFFRKSVKKLPPESNIQSSEAETKISTSSLTLEKVDFIKDCPVFSSSDPRFAYDLVLAVGKRNQLSDGVKYQILTSRDYISS